VGVSIHLALWERSSSTATPQHISAWHDADRRCVIAWIVVTGTFLSCVGVGFGVGVGCFESRIIYMFQATQCIHVRVSADDHCCVSWRQVSKFAMHSLVFEGCASCLILLWEHFCSRVPEAGCLMGVVFHGSSSER
jgi:hypothetical protein